MSSESEDSDEGLEFRRRIRKLITYHEEMLRQSDLLAEHYYKHMYKEPCYTEYERGKKWMEEILRGHHIRTVNMFRMDGEVLLRLCNELELNYGLTPSRDVSILEKVGLFLYTLAQGSSVRIVAEHFQRSTETVHQAFHDVLDSITGRGNGGHGLVGDVIRPRNPEFPRTPSCIAADPRYKDYFKDCIGCLDGTHISASIPEHSQGPFRGRKHTVTFNVLAICDFNMLFTFVLSGWEGSAHDAKVLDNAICNPTLNFPHPPAEKYYLCDKGYADRPGFLVPYSKIRYHLNQFDNEPPSNKKEAFNRAHSSLRSCIERCFGILKKRWKLLSSMPCYPDYTQVDIHLACFSLHNFIRLYSGYDDLSEDEEPPITNQEEGDVAEDNIINDTGMGHIRDRIASAIWNARTNM